MNEAIAEAGGLAVICGIVGKVLKTLPKFPNEYIPLVLLVAGAATYIAANGFSIDNLVLGILASATATGVHQVGTQTWKKNETVDIRDTPAGPRG